MSSHTDAIELDPEIVAWYQAIRAADEQIALYTGIRGRAIQHVQAAMGDATEARISGRAVITWKTSRPSPYIDKAALERDLPDVAAKYTRLKQPARPFRLLKLDDPQ